jgi:hypothetical protein
MKKRLLAGVFAAALTAMAGIHSASVSAQETPQTWTVVVHFRYVDGFSFDYVLARGVSTSRMTSILEDCARSHWTGSVVRYHCYPVAE